MIIDKPMGSCADMMIGANDLAAIVDSADEGLVSVGKGNLVGLQRVLKSLASISIEPGGSGILRSAGILTQELSRQ
jgi:hypothetical protein